MSLMPKQEAFGGGGMDKESLVQEVKNLQRSNQEAKHMWWEFCFKQLGGVRDPSRHDASVLKEFMNAYNTGALPAPTMTEAQMGGGSGARGGGGGGRIGGGGAGWGMGGGGGGMRNGGATLHCAWGQAAGGNNQMGGAGSGNQLADFIKIGQRQSQAWKTIWQNYCTTVGTGKFDPNQYDPSFITGFIDYLAGLSLADPNGPPAQAVVTPKKRGMGGMDGGPPMKKMQMGPQMIDTSPKGQLVEKIKTLQRSGDEMKQAWWAFCDGRLGGIRDPNRHEMETLQAFLVENGL